MYLALRDGPRRFTQDFSCPGLLGIPIHIYTHVDYGTFTPFGLPFQTGSSISTYTTHSVPQPRLSLAGLGSFPFVRHYLGNRFYFLFLALLRCFSSRRLLPCGCQDFLPAGCPIRISPDPCSLTAPRDFSQFATSFFVV